MHNTLTMKPHSTHLIIFVFGICFVARIHAQTSMEELPSYVTCKVTTLHTKDEVVKAYLYCNKSLDISILSLDSLDDDNLLLRTSPDTSGWKFFFDPLSHLSFSYPSEYLVKSETDSASGRRYYRIGLPKFSNNTAEGHFYAFATIELTSRSFEEEIKDLFSRDGDVWTIEGYGPTTGTYLYNDKLRGIVGNRQVAVESPDGVGYVTSAYVALFIFVELNKTNAAIFSYPEDRGYNFWDHFLVRIANSTRLK